MPGIVGLITTMPRACEPSRNCCKWWSPYATNPSTFRVRGSMKRLGVYVGWVAQKGSFSDPNAATERAWRCLLVFSGEEFPSRDCPPAQRTEAHGSRRRGRRIWSISMKRIRSFQRV